MEVLDLLQRLFWLDSFNEVCSFFLALVIGMLVVTGGIWTKWQLFSGFRKISYTLEETRDLSPSVENLHECLLFDKKETHSPRSLLVH
uniref:Uncharacterized protein n=1 Tax=Phasianus colchicus TaxID=9054 RepID=A0A669QTB0_PHACC